ncbi:MULTISPECIES: hypothetical protein [Photorhabdus]|uniref:hypothetical protein n=1 Tax=Photorhabdus TaxID=29487 RepID=UPI0003160E63|nr:hypothetical protein [Photorhabdus asymbiotica]
MTGVSERSQQSSNLKDEGYSSSHNNLTQVLNIKQPAIVGMEKAARELSLRNSANFI